MRKSFLFTVLAVLLAGFGFGGISLADCQNGASEIDGHVASVTTDQTKYYCTISAAVEAGSENYAVVLIDDAEIDEEIEIDKALIIDLNGHKILKTIGGFVVEIVSNGNLIINDNSETKAGELGYKDYNTDGAASTVLKNNVGGQFTINGGKLKGQFAVSNHGTGVINGGTFIGLAPGNVATIHSTNGGYLTINDGIFKGMEGDDEETANKEGKVIYAGGNGNKCENPATPHDSRIFVPGTIIVNGGDFAGRITHSNYGTYVIKGGTFDRNVIKKIDMNDTTGHCSGSNPEYRLTQGSFEDAGYLADGYTMEEISAGKYAVLPLYTITYELNGGTNDGENPGTYTEVSETIVLENPTKDGSSFDAWYGDAEFSKKVVEIQNGSTGNITLYAKWNEVQSLSADNGGTGAHLDDATPISQVIVEENVPASDDETEKAKDSKDNLVNPTDVVDTGYNNAIIKGGVEIYAKDGSGNPITDKSIIFETPFDFSAFFVGITGKVKFKAKHHGDSGFSFDGLVREGGTCSGGVAISGAYNGEEIDLSSEKLLTCKASTFVAYTETQNSAPTYGGRGSSGSSKKTETKAETGSVATGDTAEADTTDTTGAEEGTSEETPVLSVAEEEAAVAKFGQEQIDAYKWALKNGITTMKTVDAARLDKPLTRAELAKMMVVYIQKVLEKEPAITGDVTYTDVSESLGDLAGYIKLAYQYQIMGINADGTPIELFNPNGLVTRGEYATVFSRVLFGDKFNKEGTDFYTNHLSALEKAGVLKDTTPTMKEIRGWVMLMMYRSSQNADDIQAVAAETEDVAEEHNSEESSQGALGIANPAAEYCVAQGGEPVIMTDEDGSQYGICKLADGTEVDEWEYFRANNTEETTSESTEETAE